MKYYKVLGKGGVSCNGGDAKWSLPHDGVPGDWMPEIKGELFPCRNGYHLCRPNDLLNWLNEEIYEAEFDGEVIEEDDKVVVRKCRLLKKLDNWNEKTARLFAADCAEKVLPIFEKIYPTDNRPRVAIQASRDFANGKITAAARVAAGAAAWVAAGAAAGVAADAADAAAWAADDAARAAAWAADDAARAAADAARAAAWAAAWVAAGDAAWVAAGAASRADMTKNLFEYLDGKKP
jgi:hypothetical protein